MFNPKSPEFLFQGQYLSALLFDVLLTKESAFLAATMAAVAYLS